MERKHRALLLALPTVLTLLFFFVAPMVYILVHTLHENGFSDFVDFFGDPFYRNILWVTLRVSLVSTAISLVLGYPTAFYMARTKSRMKQVMMIVILFPFLVSAVVRSYGWMVILGTNGLLNQLLQSLGLISAPLKILNTETAVIIGMIHLLVPYMVLSLVGVLQSIDPNVEYAAYSLGASPLQTFSKVVFPLSLPGIISGCVLVFTMSMTSYVTPKLLGGSKFRMMATMVVQEINVNFDWGAASAISYILLAVILLVQIAVVLCTSGYMKRMGGGKGYARKRCESALPDLCHSGDAVPAGASGGDRHRLLHAHSPHHLPASGLLPEMVRQYFRFLHPLYGWSGEQPENRYSGHSGGYSAGRHGGPIRLPVQL